MKKNRIKGTPYIVFLLPGLIGLTVFFFAPYLYSLVLTVTDYNGNFAGISNFIATFQNPTFRLAAKNTLIFTAICIPINMLVSFWLASLLQKVKSGRKMISALFMLPLIIPSGAVVFFWKCIFEENGLLNRILFTFNIEGRVWFNSPWALTIIIIVFLFKTIGYNLVLFLAGYQFIPKIYYEAIRIEGAGRLQTLRHVTLVYMTPTIFLVFLMSIINSFKIFREIYLLFGNYPYSSVYMLQHFMNNQFASINLQRLSTASTILSAVVALVTVVLFITQRRYSESFEGIEVN